MGGGGGKAPEPKTFTPAPLQEGPAKNPIPNFFAQAGDRMAGGNASSGMTPYDVFSALQNAQSIANGDQQDNPFAALKNLKAPQRGQPSIIDILLKGRG